MEEDYGLLRRALDVYERAVKSVPPSEKLSIYEIYIDRAESLGFEKVRQIYEVRIFTLSPLFDYKAFLSIAIFCISLDYLVLKERCDNQFSQLKFF